MNLMPALSSKLILYKVSLGHKIQVLEMDEHVKCSKPGSYKGGLDVFFEHHRMWGAVQAGEAFVLAVRGV